MKWVVGRRALACGHRTHLCGPFSTGPPIAECVQQGLQLVSEGPGLGFPDACVLIASVELQGCVPLTLTYPSPGLELDTRALSMSRRAPSAVLCTRLPVSAVTTVTSSVCPCSCACAHHTDTHAHQHGLGRFTCREGSAHSPDHIF